MLAFVTSLRHPQNSADYARVEDLLRLTLRSLTAQTSEEFVVVVVGNRRPEFDLGERVHFVPVDWPAPAPPMGPRTAREPFVRDKGTKIGLGLIAARQFSPDYVMIVDADDFVHRDLAAYTAARPPGPGWIIEDGWIYSRARQVYQRQPQFNRRCGTSFVLPFEAYGVPEHLDVTATQEQVLAAYGDVLPNVLGAHLEAREWFAACQGRILEPLPFRGAVYHVETGENHSGSTLKGVAVPVGPSFAAQYGVPFHGATAGMFWRAMGPAALAGEVVKRARRVGGRVVRAASGTARPA